MILNLDRLPRVIPIGIQTENDVEVIGFDLKPWVDALPDLKWTVMATRPGEQEAYPVKEQIMVGTVLYWHPDGYDTELAGEGKAEIVGVGENQRKASGPMLTTVTATSVGATKEPGESAAPWYESIINAAEYVKQVFTPSDPHQQLVSDADGKAVWESREFYSEEAKKFPWHMVPEDDAPSAIIYKSDGTDSGVRWVKVSDYTPDVEKAVALGTVQTNELNKSKVTEDNIHDRDESGYVIAKETTSSTSGAVIRMVYAVVCFKPGYIVNGYPAPQSVGYHTATITVPGLYLPVTSNEQTYYGILFDEYVKTLDDKYIPDSIARKEDLENIQPSGSVTDEHINGLIDNKLAAFGGVYLLNKQALAPVPDGGIFAITTPWANPIVGGAVYKVNYNDTDYECECIELPADMDTPAGMYVMGNLSALGFEGGDADAPFAIVMYANGMAGMYGGVIPIDGATSVTLSIRNTVAGYYFFDGNVAKIVTIDQLKADLGLT